MWHKWEFKDKRNFFWCIFISRNKESSIIYFHAFFSFRNKYIYEILVYCSFFKIQTTVNFYISFCKFRTRSKIINTGFYTRLSFFTINIACSIFYIQKFTSRFSIIILSPSIIIWINSSSVRCNSDISNISWKSFKNFSRCFRKNSWYIHATSGIRHLKINRKNHSKHYWKYRHCDEYFYKSESGMFIIKYILHDKKVTVSNQLSQSLHHTHDRYHYFVQWHAYQ